ncbi:MULTISPECIES: hypothetical protein [Cyanophyceae]|nr:hypothetical protein [Trichocoleus sp. FACHB-40]MBD2006110.1 hypothetical protein [Trichocoleus sp. FACHB-40]
MEACSQLSSLGRDRRRSHASPTCNQNQFTPAIALFVQEKRSRIAS